MQEMVTIPRATWEDLEERARTLAGEKSSLQAVFNLMAKLGNVAGLDDTIDSITRVVHENLGGSKAAIYYLVDDAVRYADIYGEERELASLDDELVRKAYESREFQETASDFERTMMPGPGSAKACTWAMPLRAGRDCIGVLKVDDMPMKAQEARRQMEPFINYAALVLKNEILGTARLRQADEQARRAEEDLKKEIEERERVEDALMRQQEFNRCLLESMADGVVACDAGGILMLFNRAAREWHGVDLMRVPREEWAGRYDLFRADGVTPLTTEEVPLARAFRGETVVDAGMAIVAKDRPPRFILANGSVIRDEGGNKLGAVVVMRDVTELRSVEDDLRRVNEELERRVAERTAELERQCTTLRSIIDGTDALIFSVDRRYRYTRFNAAHAAVMRAIYGSEIRIGDSLLDRMTVEEDREAARLNVDRALAGESHVQAAYSGEDARSRRYFEVSHSPIRLEDGSVIGDAVFSRDVTERREADERLRESEQRYRDIFDNMLDGLALLEVTDDGRFRILEINPALERSTGIPRDQMIGRTQEEIVPPDAAVVNAKYRRCVEAGRPIEEETALDLPAGRRYYQSILIPVRDDAGRVKRIIGISRDVTGRKQAEEKMLRSDQRLRLHREQSPLGFLEWDEQFRAIEWNAACERIFGYTREEALGRHAKDLILPPEVHGLVDGIYHSLMTRTGGRHSINENVTKDGRIIICEWFNTTLIDGDGKAIGVASICNDITEQKRMENMLRESGESLRKREALLNESQRLGQIGSWDWDAVRDSIWWSDEYYRIYGLDPGIPTPNYTEHLKAYTPESAERLDAVVKRAMETGEPYALDLELAQPTASARWILARGEAKRDPGGGITGLRGTAQNITERKASEEALRKSQAFIRNILDSVDEGIIVVDREYRIVSANRAFCDSLKLPADRIVGQPCHRITHRLDRPCFESGEDCAVRRTLETGEVHSAFHAHDTGGGGKQYVEIKSYPVTDASGRVVSAIETISDVTERRRLEEQLRQAQKMEAVGTLAGGIAHDFNNILTAIMGYANLVKAKMRPDDPQCASIDQILMSSTRAAHLTRGLLAFSRKQVISPRPADLNKIMRSVETLLHRIIGEDVVLSTRLSGGSLIVMADSGQIEQVMMNLAANARDAMPEGGTLVISTEEVELGEDFVAVHGFGRPGRHALITVSDTGQGMDEKTREHIFDPFFTTKEPGRGTGLGLAIVYGIVKQHNGNINVYSEPGKGTTFRIYLPFVETRVDTVPAETAALPPRGKETILLAEDDRDVRALTSLILRDYGYTVIEAADGRDALEKFRSNAGAIDLLILDVIMPHKSGKEAFDAIKAQRPGIPALFISGYTADILDRKGITGEGIQFISKPASPVALLRKVREILNTRRRGG